ncbi:Os12g0267000 [Oryza sativa Japonica Group]|uniref:Os12g0267000 protein n=1 Tax=Oryza sativa subsp. japonica TaxID=39947 RepID=A0A0P0Y8T8_ORYSJ|nr:Os12g0267000 [Oryza sativa Japonica Group]
MDGASFHEEVDRSRPSGSSFSHNSPQDRAFPAGGRRANQQGNEDNEVLPAATSVSSHSTGGTIRERQQRRRSIIKAKKGG